jgi:hypothetical protein
MSDVKSMAGLSKNKTCQLSTFNQENRSKVISIRRGETVTVGEVVGSGVIENLWLTFPGWFWQHWCTEEPISQTILKTLILRIYWDGADKPAVEAPVGDFFGSGLCEVRSFASLYFGMSSGGFFCKFPMPFRKSFRIELENRDETIDTVLFLNALYQLDDNLDSSLGYFHAQFNTGFNPGSQPVPVADFKGSGHYSGLILSMQGKERNYLSFLEAPEYIFVDEDWQQPRLVGTGLEDYFLGGWYFREGEFIGPYHGAPIKDSLSSSIVMYRIHERDAIHFQNRLRMEFINPWEPDRLKPFMYSSVAFGYLNDAEGQGKPIGSNNDLLGWYRIRNCDHLSIP